VAAVERPLASCSARRSSSVTVPESSRHKNLISERALASCLGYRFLSGTIDEDTGPSTTV
jgi:hypothetical protein